MYNILTTNYLLNHQDDYLSNSYRLIVLRKENLLEQILELDLETPFVFMDNLIEIPEKPTFNYIKVNLNNEPQDKYTFCIQQITKNPVVSERFFVVPSETRPVGNNIKYIDYSGVCGVRDVYSFYLHLESLLQSSQFKKLENKHVCHVIERLSRVKLIG